MERSPVRTTGPSPALGADTHAVLAALGLDEATIAALHEAGVIRAR
jgi:crotonobetainyl-CoA:carnitine CoA-transferase CaiB-like acyl-CoA transferase